MRAIERRRACTSILRLAPLLIVSMLWLGALARPAQAQSFVQNPDGSFTLSLPNGETITATPVSENTFNFTVQGPQPVSGTVTFNVNGNSDTLVFTGTETINGQAQQINCTVTITGNAFSSSGQCGPLQFSAVAAGTPLAASIAGTSHATVRAQVQSIITILSSRIGAISRDIAQSRGGGDQQSDSHPAGYSGISAGTAAKDWGVWADGSGSYLRNDSSVAAFRGYGATALTGIDYVYRDAWVIGLTGGYVRTDVSVAALQGRKVSQGATLGPYLSYIINDHYTIDGIFTYNRLSNDTGGVSPASFNSNRYTTSVNFNAFWDAKPIRWTGTFGYAYAVEVPDSSAPAAIGGLPTTIHYGAFSIGGEAAYPIGKFEPYLPLTVQYETTETRDGTGRAGVLIGIGTRYQIQDTIKAGFQVITEQFRTHSQNVTGSANLRVTF